MNDPNKLPEIKKEAFTKARESLGLSTKELSGMACLSVRQIEQIENGEISSFYGPQVKVTAAKKVAGILKLKEEDAFDFSNVAPNKKESIPNLDKAKPESSKAIAEPAKTLADSSKTSQISSAKKSNSEKKIIPSQPEKDQSKSANPKRKIYIAVGVAAALVFSIVNLRPLFFPEVIKEEVIVVEQAQAPASTDTPVDPKSAPTAGVPEPAAVAAAPAAPASTAATPVPSTECPPAETAAVSYKPDAPKKAGDMVYLQSKTAQTVCVLDASGRMQSKTLEPGVGASIYGKPPLKVLTTGQAAVDMFYQGAKVRLSNTTAKTILLEPAEIIQPLAPTDSQFR